ncbi:PREDICTED: sperm flagellar protein 1-like [Myotis brandtii]|uniref:sperm flagellar protein 1-like n=1 Tax=Myotis brandtii TaxID=109478 RepID=UPI0007044534|nr:PREDICTED: sperm flagellar protein 1-like [Myotis brandtii]
MLGAARPSSPAPPPPSPLALRGLYAWLDRLPLSRPKRHLARDFSDGGEGGTGPRRSGMWPARRDGPVGASVSRSVPAPRAPCKVLKTPEQVMLAEIVKHYHPRLVDLHNYVPTCNTDQKLSNWSTLNRKVFHKLRFCVSEGDIRKVVANTPGAIEPILCALKEKVMDGAVREDPPSTGLLIGAFDPGVCSADADGLWLGLATTPHAGLPSSPVPSGVKTLQSQRTEKTGHYACRGWDPAGGPRKHLNTGVQQLLEEKEQALAILQETVQVLQMKVVRLEHLVKLKDQRINELTRRGIEPQ